MLPLLFKKHPNVALNLLVAGVGFEPTTFGQRDFTRSNLVFLNHYLVEQFRSGALSTNLNNCNEGC